MNASELQNHSKAYSAIQSRKMVFLVIDFIIGKLLIFFKKIKIIEEMFFSWPIPRGNCRDSAPQGDRI